MFLSQTMAWVLLWCVSGIVDIVLQAVFIFYQKEWSSETIFWIWNLKGAAFNEVFHILIPFALSVPADDNSENSPSNDFFVRKKSVLEPRRSFESTPRTLPLKIFVGQSAPKKIDKKSDPHRATFLKVAYKANILHKRVELPSIEAQKEDIVLSIPNLHQKDTVPCIVYCKVHQDHKIAS